MGQKSLPKFLFLFFFCTFRLFAQDLNYARAVVDTLASPSMHGRGYVNDGDKLAAEYLENQFQQWNLQSFSKGYRQEFSLSVNTFPGEMNLKINKKKLIPGKDFIVSPDCPGAKGKAKIVLVDEKILNSKGRYKRLLKKDLSGKFIMLDDTGKATEPLQKIIKGSLKSKGIIELKDKLTWSVSSDTASIPKIELLRGVISKPKKIEYSIENKFMPSYVTQNLIGFIRGTQYPDSFLVFSAHYDHLGQMGANNYFPGANDNATGCAMLLNLAKYYSMHPSKYSIAFMAFGGEEAGLLGSEYYTSHPLFPLEKIKFLVNLDLLGTGEEGLTVVNATEFPDQFKTLTTINEKGHYFPKIKPRGKAANSDHYFFTEKGVKTFFIYTLGGIKAYHDIYDRAETLPLTKFEEAFKLLTDFEKVLTAGN